MPIRSVAELLPRPFEELTLDDVRDIVGRVGEERETIFFERKAVPTKDGISKSCAAFANSLGGVLLVGIPDGTADLLGFDEPRIGDPSVWIKDVLRDRVTPLPPFRARTFELNDRLVLVVLVERSTTTPHLLTKQGAIYVRSPGSSDPVGVSDQVTLHELIRRGDEAVRSAEARASQEVVHEPSPIRYLENAVRMWSLALSPTGRTSETDHLLRYNADLLEFLAPWLPTTSVGAYSSEGPYGDWGQHWTRIYRLDKRPFGESSLHVLVASTDATVALHEFRVPERDSTLSDEALLVDGERVVGWLENAYRSACSLLTECATHGDVRVAFLINAGPRFRWGAEYHDSPNAIATHAWTALDASEEQHTALLTRVKSDVGRAFGQRPSVLEPADEA